MYCINCGKEVDKNADVCLKCGKLLNQGVKEEVVLAPVKPKIPGRGLGIAGMVTGIISTYYALIIAFLTFIMLLSGEELYYEEKLIVMFIFLFWPMVLSIVSLGLSIGAKAKNNLKMTNAGLILSIVSISICILCLLGFVIS